MTEEKIAETASRSIPGLLAHKPTRSVVLHIVEALFSLAEGDMARAAADLRVAAATADRDAMFRRRSDQ